MGTLTTPNTCSAGWKYSSLLCDSSRYDRYNFAFDGSTLPSGDYVRVFTITDRSGQIVQRSSPFTVSKPPVITLASPPDGALAYGSLRLRGSFIPDLTGTVSVTASLTTMYPSRNPGQVVSFRPILSTTGSSVDRDVDLSGIPPGTYYLSVIARNRGGTAEIKQTLIVTSTQALRLDPLFVGDGFGIPQFIAEGDVIAYRDQNEQVRLLNAATGATRDLGILRNGLVVGGGRLYSSVWMPGCSNVFGDVCLHEWSLSGGTKPLAPGYSSSYFQVVARSSTLAWREVAADRSSIKVYDADSSQTTTVTPPAGMVVEDSFDLDRRDGHVMVFYAARPANVDPPQPTEIFGWSSRTGVTQRVSTPGTFNNGHVMTDGTRVAWWRYSGDFQPPDPPPNALLSQSVDGGPITTLSTSVRHSVLRDGVLAWIESTPTGVAIKASTSTGVQTLATDPPPATGGGSGPGNEESTWLFDTSSRHVLYRQGRKFLAWNAVTNQTRIVMDTADVRAVQVNGGFAFFTIGRSLYRVPLGQ